MPEAAVALINQVCKFHRSTLLGNLNCAGNVPNIKFNAAPKTSKLDVFIEMTSSFGNINKRSGLHFRQFCKIIAHFKNQSRYASGLYDVKGTWCAIYLKY